ncbi:MAG: hypothetical protein RBS39_13535 [Phycisphaerales bacterium]|jgi:hypothetical protein|nr:hypothetical protein [Phycisphaerales bacterium]
MDMRTNQSRLFIMLAFGGIACCAVAARPALAQATSNPPPVDATDTKEEPEGDGGLESLDDLLGLEEDAGARPAEAGQRELDEKLAMDEAVESFSQAVRLMGDTASRLRNTRDVGLDTQRQQQDILSRLDQLIAQAEKNQQQSSSSSSSSSSQDQQQQQQNQPNQPQQSQQNEPGRGDNTGQEIMPQASRDVRMRGALQGARAAWGALPERLREALLQGSSDQFSSVYESLTERYYRRLAEEPRP